MKLEFSLLVIDDNPPNYSDEALRQLDEALLSVGFNLKRNIAPDISLDAIEQLARQGGSEYDLVIIDCNLGSDNPNGSVVAKAVRQLLPYTDIIFYSSAAPKELLKLLAEQEVAGVFVADRTNNFGDVLEGVAETIIRKAVDLTHMRGIALAEVADMDVMLGAVLTRAFSSTNEAITAAATRTLEKLVEGGKSRVKKLEKHQAGNEILDVVQSSLMFTLSDKYRSLSRVAKALELDFNLNDLNSQNIIEQRNLLAHAQEVASENGAPTLKSIKDGNEIKIDDGWMTVLRTELRDHRIALAGVCARIDAAIV